MPKSSDRAVQRRLGERLQALRAACELTQEVVADRIGRSQKYLSELERGQKSPSLETLVAIAHKGFEIKLSSLMFGIDEDVGAEVQNLGDALASRSSETRGDILRAMELLLGTRERSK